MRPVRFVIKLRTFELTRYLNGGESAQRSDTLVDSTVAPSFSTLTTQLVRRPQSATKEPTDGL